MIPDEGIVEYLKDCYTRMGASFFQTPGDTVRDFVGLLNMLEQDSSQDWQALLKRQTASSETSAKPPSPRQPARSGDLSEFRL